MAAKPIFYVKYELVFQYTNEIVNYKTGYIFPIWWTNKTFNLF